jgi:hypothetical protein
MSPGGRAGLRGMRFGTTIATTGPAGACIDIPPEVVLGLGAGPRPPVWLTIGEHTYRTRLARRRGRYRVGLGAEARRLAGVGAGAPVHVDLQLDTAPRP